MFGLLFELEAQIREKRAIEKNICMLKSSNDKKIALEELNELAEKEKELFETLKKIKIKIKCIENDIKTVDKKIDSISNKLYGFGTLECERLEINKKIESLNTIKMDLYERMMESMEIVRRFSIDMRDVRDRANISRERYGEIVSGIEEKRIKLNCKLKKIEKSIKSIKANLLQKNDCFDGIERFISGEIGICFVKESICSNCMAAVSIGDIENIKNESVVLCRKCGGILYLKGTK